MAWELPSKPINLEELFGNSVQMEKIDNRIDQKISNELKNDKLKKPSNIYYTNIPSYNKIHSQYTNPYYSYSKQSNKMQYYLSYADKIINELKFMKENLPTNQPLNQIDVKRIANT